MEQKQKKKIVDIVEVRRHGKELIIPEGVEIPAAIDILQRQAKYEEEKVQISETLDCFVWEGALALSKAMQRQFGFFNAETVESFFGDQPPSMISIEVNHNETTLVPWGEFSLPGIDGRIATGHRRTNGRVCFVVNALVRRKFEKVIRELIELTRKIAHDESIYRGKAIRIRFIDNDGDKIPMPEPKFLDLSKVNANELIFSDSVKNAIQTSIFTPIEQADNCRKYKIPLKRGVLLCGPYGTGKTLTANISARKCIDNGFTFLYCERASELGEMVKFARQYEPALIFCEDIDREVTGARSITMDDILNVVDGIESKSAEIMIILTTNHVEKINKAMLRPGRLDAVIYVQPPDSGAVQQLVRLYARNLVADNENLTEVGNILSGQIPAVIRECVERSKLTALKNSQGHTNGGLVITATDLIEAAKTMTLQLDLLKEIEPSKSIEENLGSNFINIIEKATQKPFEKIHNRLN